MGLALVGGAFLSSFLNVLFDRMASRQVVDFFRARKLDVFRLEKLKITLNSVNGLLDDAEEKQITRTAVKNWLDELKDAAYEADDLLDDITYEALQSELEAGGSQLMDIKGSVGAKLEERLEKILEKIEYLVKQKDVLGLREGAEEKVSSQKVPTTCLVDESSVYGRDDDKEAIMKMLQPDSTNSNELDVIPIVGMGGIGKTTLAQLVYNDGRVEEWFSLRAWVCVSEDYDIFKITKEILKQVNSVNCDHLTPNQLQLKLKESLKGKKFLLILDDVWNDKYADWDTLQTPLKSGVHGSKIIVTTRNESVASTMCRVPSYPLRELDAEDCWSLFAKHAFSGGNIDPKKEVIGREMVRKCGGLPLAAKTLGGLLRGERDIAKWKKISKSNLWDLLNDSILPALRLSYHYLPSHLKQCFAFCAIFPKDYAFEKNLLILLWMAEGVLVQPKGEKDMEEVGEEYFDDLVSRSFFQLSSSGGSHFIMHDLINDLARHVCGEFLSRLEGDNSCKIAKRTRHLSYRTTGYDGSNKFEGLYDAQLLRTFLPLPTWMSQDISDEVIHDLIPALRCLRVLSLSLYGNIVDLPISIGNLKHLQYLNLEGTSIERLPEIISTLYKLQTLILNDCKEFVELPMNIGRLINLRYLDIKNTNLQWMPPQMGRLKHLQKLTNFILGKQRESSSSIRELGELPHLRGRLVIDNLQYVVDTPESLKDILMYKVHLKELELMWYGDTDDSLHERGILEKLRPCASIERLSITGYGGTRFADWMGDSSFSNITSLQLWRCKHCSCLPPLGQLVSLKDLFIGRFDAVITVGPELYGNSMKMPFRSLKTLRIKMLVQWQEWYIHEGESGAFPVLRRLYITDCPNLRMVLPRCFPSLEELDVERCEQVMVSFPTPRILKIRLEEYGCHMYLRKLPCGLYSLNTWYLQLEGTEANERRKQMKELMAGLCSSLEVIRIDGDESLKCFQLEFFPNLNKLCIDDCSNLKSLSGPEAAHGNLMSLSHLEIKRCNRFSISELLLEKLPSGLYHLKVVTCYCFLDFTPIPKGIVGMCGLPTSLEEIEVRSSDSLRCLSLELFPNLKRLNVCQCRFLESFFASEEPLGHVKLLDTLTINDCPRLISCLERGLHVPNLRKLKSLELWNCSNLISLPECMHFLPSLVKLVIVGCPELESFPEGGLPAKLESLEIIACKKLMDGLMHGDLRRLSALSHCFFGNYDGDLECFPEETLFPSTLTSLKISLLENLKFLNYKGLRHLTNLKRLEINYCFQLQCLPGEGLPSSLSYLNIWRCPLLEKRCEHEKGEDWLKISHISHISFNNA